MPQYYRSGWSKAGQAAQSLGHDLQNIAVGLAQQKAQQNYQHESLLLRALENQQLNKHRNEQTRLMEQHYAAQNAELAAQAAFHKQQAGNLQEQSDSGLVLGDILQHIATNPNMSPEDQALYQGAAVNRGARIGAQHPANIMEQIAQGFAMRDPRMQQLMAAGGASKLYQNVGPNSVGVSPVPGVAPIQGPVTLAPGTSHLPPQIGPIGGSRTADAFGVPQVGKVNNTDVVEFGHLQQALKSLSPFGLPDETDPNYAPYQQTLNAYTNSPVLNRQRQRALPMSPYSNVVEGMTGPQPDPAYGFPVGPPPTPMPQGPMQEEQDMGQGPQEDSSFYVPQYMGNDNQPGQRSPHPMSQVPSGFKLPSSNAAIKAARANDLERQNPSLPRQVIIDMVNQEFQGK